MERLTFKTDLGISIDKNEDCPTMSICWNCDIPPSRCNYFKDAIEKLAEYEDIEEQGLLVKLPCKKGDKAWCVMFDTRYTYRGVFEATVEEINWNTEDGLKIFVRFESDLQPCCTYTFFHYDVDTRLFFGESAKEKAEKEYAKNAIG